MKTYLRLLSYLKKYKWRFIAGLFFALMVSIFNALSMMALKPIFDILGAERDKPFQLSMSKEEVALLKQAGYTKRLTKLFDKTSIYKKQKEWLNEPLKTREITFTQKIKLFKLEKTFELNEVMVNIKPFKILIYVCLIVLPIYLLRLGSLLATVYFIVKLGLQSVRDIRSDLYEKLLHFPLTNFVREKTGVWMSRIINDITIVSDAVSMDLRVSITNFFLITTHLTFLAFVSYKLLLLCLVGVPLVLWPVNALAKKIKSITTGEQEMLALLNGHLQEMISGIRVIRAFGMEGYEKEKFDNINDSLFRKNYRYRMSHTIGPAIVELVTSIIVIGLIMYGGMAIFNEEMTSGSFFTFLFTLIVILSPIKQMTAWYNLTHRTIAASERVFEIMDKESDIQDPENPHESKILEDKIEFKNVTFSYPESEEIVLQNINIEAKIGTTVALVGHSGAGKSTLVDLIPRFYHVNDGEILFDGVNIKNFRIKDIRDKIGVVTQEIFLFNGTIKENISYGNTNIPMANIVKAAQMAFADEFISKLPKKYDTQIGERGLMLSGGQRQRLSIARALLKNPEILILDEATSALDAQSELLVQQALEQLMKNRTTFVIAHRLSTIFKADNILVIDEGKIVEHGTHGELISQNGVYKDLYTLQFQAKK